MQPKLMPFYKTTYVMKYSNWNIAHFYYNRGLIMVLCMMAYVIGYAQVDPTGTQSPDPTHQSACPPPAFYTCNPATMTPAELTACNRTIAMTYAPDVSQFVSTCYDNDANGDADRLVKVNFDGNWDATDNWENMDDLSSGTDFSNFGSDAYPNAYYAVLWTNHFWLITYSYYYARDWAEDFFLCGEDEHENDLIRTMLIIKRPKNMNETPASLLVGYVIGNHDGGDFADCVSRNQLRITNPCQDGSAEHGVHISIWSTSGSHALHDEVSDGYEDPPSNPCRICKENKLISYSPGANPSVPVLCPGVGQCPLDCDWGGLDDCALGLANVLGTAHREVYGLIDVFDPTEGLWEQRDNAQIFGQGGPYDEQHFVCTNGNGCDGWNVSIFGQQVLFNDRFASAPWNGGVGINPIPFIQSGDLGTMDCNCAQPAAGCTPTTFSDNNFVFNPYLCDYYLSPLSDNGGIPITPQGVGVSIEALSGFKQTTGLSGIYWNITTVPANALTCVGCSTHQPNITLYSAQDPCASTGNITVHITASFVTADCGEKMVERNLVFKKPGPIVSGDQLVITQEAPPCPIGVSGSYKVTPTNPNWTYNWHCYACQITSSTNSAEIFAKRLSSSYVPIYSVTVTNGCGSAVSDEFQLGACSNFMGEGASPLKVFPNPVSGLFHLTLETSEPAGAAYQVRIYNQAFELKFSDQSQLPAWDVDASSWPGGMYYIAVQNGNTAYSKTFYVNHDDAPILQNSPK